MYSSNAGPDMTHRSANEPQPRATIPFNRPALVGNEMEYVRDAIERGHISGDGTYTRRCEALLSEVLGGARVLLTTSCTHALEMSALLLDVGPDDEFIVPAFTFSSTANAFVLRGARPLFVDVRPDTLNIDAGLIEKAITPRTRAIVVVHYAGVACEMTSILAIADARGIPVIEDNAHGLFGAYRGRPLGTWGAMSALSFHETKNVFCGEGGALVLTDPSAVSRAEVLREKGTNRARFFRGEVDKYTWLDVGSSYVPSDMLAAFLLAQLEKRSAVQSARRRIWERYRDELAEWASRKGIALPVVPADSTPAYHLFHLLLPSLQERDAFIEHLRDHGVRAIFHYLPLHVSPMGERLGGRAGDCPVAESASDRIVRLPFFASMTNAEQSAVIDAALAF
ncbi:MAG TPA: dTDP-4-amino-4,6-dideoxygalactose transaminase [Thermoanaerobaculia bacterium]|nr:dTDP-4-amino-4,6-dideoxygalactose transaminase [Thermoanaerobaculia bacterium]